MLCGTPSRGPPVICLLDSSSEEEGAASDVGGGNWCVDDDECMVTAVVTAEERAAAARRAAVVLDASASPQPSTISSAATTGYDDTGNASSTDESVECDRPGEEASVWGRLAVAGTAVKPESSALPIGKIEPATPSTGATTRTGDASTDLPSSDSEDEDLYGPEPSSISTTRAYQEQPATIEAREHADAVAGWSEPDIEEFAQSMDAMRASNLSDDELCRRKPIRSGAPDETSRQIPRSPAASASASSSDDEDVDPYAAAQAYKPKAVHRNRIILEDSSDEDDQEASKDTGGVRSSPRRYDDDLLDEEDENAESDGGVDLSTSLDDEADELAKELEDLQLYTTSIVTPNSKRVDSQVESSVNRRSVRLSARKQKMGSVSRLNGDVSSGEEPSDEEPWDRSEEEDSSLLEENSLDDFIVDTDEEDDRLPGELGQLLTKLRGTNAGDYSDDDSDFSDEELEGEYYDPNDLTMEQTFGTDGSVMSDDNLGDDGASLRDFVVDEDGEDSRRSGRNDQHTSEVELLQDLTNLNVSLPLETKGPNNPYYKPNRKTKKKEVKGWTLSRVATAVRESGRALGPRSNVSIAASEWSRHRKRLTMEIFQDLNTRCVPFSLFTAA
jgi:hypothetical protein